jgi:ArsR family transcriptional regulator, virulence genes transcriptional regulator
LLFDSQALSMTNYSLIFNNVNGNGTYVKVDLLNTKKAALILRAVNHKLRQQMLKLIDEHGKMTVTQLYLNLRLEQSVASQHLSILRKAALVKTVRNGKFIYYSINGERFEVLNEFVKNLLN